MAKHVGAKLPEDLLEILTKGNTVCDLSTFSEKGLPHTTPIQWIYPKGVESFLISIHKEHTGYRSINITDTLPTELSVLAWFSVAGQSRPSYLATLPRRLSSHILCFPQTKRSHQSPALGIVV